MEWANDLSRGLGMLENMGFGPPFLQATPGNASEYLAQDKVHVRFPLPETEIHTHIQTGLWHQGKPDPTTPSPVDPFPTKAPGAGPHLTQATKGHPTEPPEEGKPDLSHGDTGGGLRIPGLVDPSQASGHPSDGGVHAEWNVSA